MKKGEGIVKENKEKFVERERIEERARENGKNPQKVLDKKKRL